MVGDAAVPVLFDTGHNRHPCEGRRLVTARKRNGRPPSLTSTTVAEVIRLFLDGWSVRKIAAQVGVGKSTVGRLVVRLDRPANLSKNPTQPPTR